MSTACGHVVTTHRILGAQRAIMKAEHRQADEFAIYEITKAREYLHKAKEEEGYADYQVSMRYGQLSIDHAEKAREQAITNRGQSLQERSINPNKEQNEP